MGFRKYTANLKPMPCLASRPVQGQAWWRRKWRAVYGRKVPLAASSACDERRCGADLGRHTQTQELCKAWISFCPAAGVVEAWAAGGTWAQVTADSNLDDGDVARLLGRTADLLRQAGYCTALPSPVRREAKRAAHAMNRSPISELLSL